MAALSLNGLAVPVSVQNADNSPDVIEDAARTVGGQMVRSRRAVVGSLKAKTIPVSSTLAADIANQMKALMDHWSFDDAVYWEWSEGGIGTDGGTANQGTAAPAPKFGAGYAELSAGDTWSVDTQITGAWTVMLWSYEGGVWHHYALTSTGAKYKDGATYGGSIAFIAVTSGSVVIGDAGSGATQRFDDLLVLYWVCSSDMVAGVYNLGVAVGAPDPVATGDLISEWSGQQATCESPDLEFVPHMGSSFNQYGQVIAFQIQQRDPA